MRNREEKSIVDKKLETVRKCIRQNGYENSVTSFETFDIGDSIKFTELYPLSANDFEAIDFFAIRLLVKLADGLIDEHKYSRMGDIQNKNKDIEASENFLDEYISLIPEAEQDYTRHALNSALNKIIRSIYSAKNLLMLKAFHGILESMVNAAKTKTINQNETLTKEQQLTFKQKAMLLVETAENTAKRYAHRKRKNEIDELGLIKKLSSHSLTISAQVEIKRQDALTTLNAIYQYDHERLVQIKDEYTKDDRKRRIKKVTKILSDITEEFNAEAGFVAQNLTSARTLTGKSSYKELVEFDEFRKLCLEEDDELRAFEKSCDERKKLKDLINPELLIKRFKAHVLKMQDIHKRAESFLQVLIQPPAPLPPFELENPVVKKDIPNARGRLFSKQPSQTVKPSTKRSPVFQIN